MSNIKILKEKFDNLPISADNIELYNSLLNLDISDFKPLMEEILNGRLDVEDTRLIFENNFLNDYNSQFGKSNISNNDLIDPRYSTDIMKTVTDNILSAFLDQPQDIIKETVLIRDNTDLKYEIAKRFKEKNNIELTEIEINKLLPIVESAIIADLSMKNRGPSLIKENQIQISNRISYKPDAKL